jgi:hypothetical protein
MLILFACVLTGCSAPAPHAPTHSQTLPQPIVTPAAEPADVPTGVDDETMKQLWSTASEKQRADLLAEAGLTAVPDEVTDDMIDEVVRRTAEHGIDVTPDDVREFLDWVTTN